MVKSILLCVTFDLCTVYNASPLLVEIMSRAVWQTRPCPPSCQAYVWQPLLSKLIVWSIGRLHGAIVAATVRRNDRPVYILRVCDSSLAYEDLPQDWRISLADGMGIASGFGERGWGFDRSTQYSLNVFSLPRLDLFFHCLLPFPLNKDLYKNKRVEADCKTTEP